MRTGAAVSALVVTGGLLAGCAATVDGSGSRAGGGGAGASTPAGSSSSQFPTQDFPTSGSSSGSAGSSPASPGSACPNIVYPTAHLSFTCITSGMKAASDRIWPLLEIKTVDSSGWVLQQGAGRYTGPSGSLTSIAQSVRAEMVQADAYLKSPAVDTVRTQTGKFGTRPAVIVQSLITLNPTAAARQKTQVRQERLWILAVQVSSTEVSLWHVSLPDLAKSLWPKVPAAIATIKVS